MIQTRSLIPIGHIVLWALVAATASGCVKSAEGIEVELQLPAGREPAFRPEFALMRWYRSSHVVIAEARVPENGSFAPTGALGSVFVRTNKDFADVRALTVRGFRADQVTSGGFIRVTPNGDAIQKVTLLLGPPLVDSDKDGHPDVIDPDCTSPARDAGTSDTAAQAVQDANATDATISDANASDAATPDAPGCVFPSDAPVSSDALLHDAIANEGGPGDSALADTNVADAADAASDVADASSVSD